MNWDKPLPIDGAVETIALSEYHGLDITTGREWIDLVGCKEGDRFYDCYLRFCELMNSPLGKALS